MEQHSILCPICKSTSLSANQENFNNTRAALGNMAFGTQGLLYGNTGLKRVVITCLSCGHTFNPGEGATENDFEQKNTIARQKIEEIEGSRQNKRTVAFIALIFIVGFIIWLVNLFN